MIAKELVVSAARSVQGLRALDLSLTRQRPQPVLSSSPAPPCLASKASPPAPPRTSGRSAGVPDRLKVEKAEPTSEYEESEEESPAPDPPVPVERERTRSPRRPSPSYRASGRARGAGSEKEPLPRRKRRRGRQGHRGGSKHQRHYRESKDPFKKSHRRATQALSLG